MGGQRRAEGIGGEEWTGSLGPLPTEIVTYMAELEEAINGQGYTKTHPIQDCIMTS